MINEIEFSDNVRSKMLNGMEKVSKVVSATLGPKGRLIAVEQQLGSPILSKDGVFCAKAVGKLKDPYENMGANLLKEVSSKTNETDGDGPQPLYAKVLTPNGFVRIDSLKIGDEICRIDGTTQKVIGIFPKGKKELYRVHFDHGDYVECCADHLWTVTNTNSSSKKLQTLTVSEMIEKGIYRNNKEYKSSKFFVPNNKSFFNTKDVVLDPFLVGVLIGDGCFTEKQDYCEITIGYKKEQKIIPNLVLPEGIFLKRNDYPKRNACRFKFEGKTKDGKTMLDLLKDIGLFGCNSFTKHIPTDYLINSFENREKLLNGLMVTDGYLNYKNLFEYSTVSKQLCDDIVFLFKSLGIDVYTQLKERSIEKGAFSNTPVYRISQLKGYKYGRRITAIEDMHKEEEMMCIKVSGDEELYITDNFITTHNTSTSCVLAYAMAKEGMKAVSGGVPPISLKRGIDKACEKVIEEIKKVTKPIESNEDLIHIATISANNDESIGSIIAEAVEKVGKNGVITTGESSTSETTIEFMEGMRFDRGMLSPYFTTNNTNGLICEYKNPYILVTDKNITNINEIAGILQTVSQSGRPLAIVCDDMSNEVLTVLVKNKLNGALPSVVVKAPYFGEVKKAFLEDLAILVGATYFTDAIGNSINKCTINDLGSSESIKCTKDDTIIVGGNGDSAEIENRVNIINSQIKVEKKDFNLEKLRERLAKLCGGVAIVKVGANSDTEMEEKKHRVEDTLSATRSALEGGIVCGGGVTLARISKTLSDVKTEDEDEKRGVEIVAKALTELVKCIANNAGFNGDVILNKILEDDNMNNGYDFSKHTLVYENIFDKGIVDPANVEISAIKNASSVVGLILMTEGGIVMVNDENDKCKK